MADSASYQWSLSITKDGKSTGASGSYSYTPASIYKGTGIRQAIPNSWTAITWGGATTVASFAIDNLDGTNAVDLATANDSTGIFATVPKGGTSGVIPTKSGVTYYAKSAASTVNIEKHFDGAS